MSHFTATTIVLAAAALMWSLAISRGTSPSHADFTARLDRCKLIALILAGMVCEAIRGRLEDNLLVAIGITVVLASIAIASVVYVRRLYCAYRQTGAARRPLKATPSRSAPTRKP